jgi:hypothetical protein
MNLNAKNIILIVIVIVLLTTAGILAINSETFQYWRLQNSLDSLVLAMYTNENLDVRISETRSILKNTQWEKYDVGHFIKALDLLEDDKQDEAILEIQKGTYSN